MCGIAGFADFSFESQKNELVAMTDSLKHRGPDASGYFYSKENTSSVGLGHRRLSIIDLSPAGNQPMQFNDEQYWIVFNGEIYNYLEIRKILESTGHRFISGSDTEVILHAFQEWGPEMVNRFIGMFALVLLDRKNQKLYGYRDRAGVKPLFYFWNENLFLFGSELKALVSHPRFRKDIDMAAISSYFQFGYIPAPHSIYTNTCKLMPGHYFVLDLIKKGIELKKYWDVYDCYNKDKIKIDAEEAVQQTEKVLEKAFNYRMIADVPVGVFLSGGYDSSALAALLQKNRMEKIKTFTIGFQDKSIDEAPYARKIAGILGTDHHELYCTEQDALDIMENLFHYYDEPLADNSSIPSILVSKMARQKVTVALSADAGDEIFGGYIRYPMMQNYYQRFNAIPGAVRKPVSYLLDKFSKGSQKGIPSNRALQRKSEKVFTLLKDPSALNVYLSLTEQFSGRERTGLLKCRIPAAAGAHYREGLERDFFDPLSYAMAKDYQTYMVDDVLQKVDRATMSVSLEGREPFLDQHVVEWAARLPNDLKIKNGERKFLLRQIVHRYIPRETMQRPKMGFVVPVNNWLSGPLKDLVEVYLGEDFIIQQNLFNPAYVAGMRKNFEENPGNNKFRIWFLLMFQLWYKRWMTP